jgi:hypothetical protein
MAKGEQSDRERKRDSDKKHTEKSTYTKKHTRTKTKTHFFAFNSMNTIPLTFAFIAAFLNAKNENGPVGKGMETR